MRAPDRPRPVGCATKVYVVHAVLMGAPVRSSPYQPVHRPGQLRVARVCARADRHGRRRHRQPSRAPSRGAIMVLLPEMLREIGHLRAIVFGLILFFSILFLPRGVFSEVRALVSSAASMPTAPGRGGEGGRERASCSRSRGLSKHSPGHARGRPGTFAVSSGELVGLIGPNGAGKTTLFNCIAGAQVPTAGSVAFDGHAIAGLDSIRIARRGLARTYQNLRVFPDMTVFDNVSAGAIGRIGTSIWSAIFPSFVRRHDEAIAEATLRALELFDLMEYADQPAGNLSYGRRRISRWRAHCRWNPSC